MEKFVDMQYEYMFFDSALAGRFAEAVRQLGLPVRVDEGEQINVCIPEELAHAHQAELEALYDEYFFGEQAALVEEAYDDFSASGIQIQLKDGRYTTVMIAPDIMNRLLSVFSVEELNQFMHEVARAIEAPNGGGTVCEVARRQAEEI